MWDFFAAPFSDPFMRRALVASIAVALGAAPIGVFLTLRRMSLTGDALSHGILSGAAVGYLLAGMSLAIMTIGGLLAGIAVAMAAGFVSRRTAQRQDASLAAFYLISLALAVLLISTRADAEELETFLFGSVLSIGNDTLLLLVGISTLTLVGVALIFRPLLMESFDPGFLRQLSGAGSLAHYVFLAMAVLILVAGFHALGTLMALGIMLVPAAAARFWSRSVAGLIAIAAAIATASSIIGLLVAYQLDVPASSAIILCAGIAYLLSVTLGTEGSLRRRTGSVV
jgi:zinc/manganese transport system permease protein